MTDVLSAPTGSPLAAPIAADTRDPMPDLARAVAVFGIVMVNVAVFARPLATQFYGDGLKSAADSIALFISTGFFAAKSYSLFSIMFGAGLGYQMLSAERRGVAFGAQYARRMVGLFVLGLLHVTFAFMGDILLVYAVLGGVLFAFRDVSVKALKITAICFIVAPIVLTLLGAGVTAILAMAVPEVLEEINAAVATMMPDTSHIYRSSDFVAIAGQRWKDWAAINQSAGFVQYTGVMGYFLAGYAMLKSGVMSNADAPLWSKSRRVYLPLGLAFTLPGAWLAVNASSQFAPGALIGMSLVMLGAPLQTLGYLGLVAAWAKRPRGALTRFFARAGTATLSAYLLQSIVLSFVFCGYGLGFYGTLGAAQSIAIAAVTGLFSIIAMSLWRARFARGPFEWALRRFTYLGQRT